MAIVTDEEYIQKALEILAKRQDSRKVIDKQRQLQRRNTVTDSKTDFQTMLRGENRIYTGFKITKDIQFMMKYSFNLHIRPFTTTFSRTVTTSKTSLSVSNDVINPNPHDHDVNIGIEVSEHTFDTDGLRLKIEGIDLTDAIIEEYGSFIDGFGYFPSQDESFDILRIIDYLPSWQQAVILAPGMKELEISQDSNSLCECEISYYIKYNHVDRGGLD